MFLQRVITLLDAFRFVRDASPHCLEDARPHGSNLRFYCTEKSARIGTRRLPGKLSESESGKTARKKETTLPVRCSSAAGAE
jgi:hypothetical protein